MSSSGPPSSDPPKKMSFFDQMMKAGRPLEGGWSNSAASGNRPGYQTPISGLPQAAKEEKIDEFHDRGNRARALTPAHWAVNNSMLSRENLEPAHGESEADHQAKRSGLLNEAYETARLAVAGVEITGSQQHVFSALDHQERIPDLTVNDGGTPRFVEIKTARIQEPKQITDVFNTDTPSTGVDVVFSSSSRNIDQGSLDHLKALEERKSTVEPTRTLRVRSNSMREGAFISPTEMQERINRRATIAHDKVPK